LVRENSQGTLRGKMDDAYPNDESSYKPLPRPKTDAAHNRFFEDGEQPPARYDLSDAIAYIEVRSDPIESARWRRLAQSVAWTDFDIKNDPTVNYYAVWLIGLFTGCLPFLFLLAPVLKADITRKSLNDLTGNVRQFGLKYGVAKRWFELEIANCLGVLSWLLAMYALYLIGSVVADVFRDANRSISQGQFVVSVDRSTYPLVMLASILVLFCHTVATVRVWGFATHLVLDYDLGPIQALRANWKITRGRTWQLMRLKLRLWFWKYLVGTLSLGFGLLHCEPYTSAVWTAAYLDIAGSEPPRDIDAFNTPSSPATPMSA
jgi:hypothetical protein